MAVKLMTGPTIIPLTDDYTKRHMAMAVPGSLWDTDRKKWVLMDPTPRAAAVALRIFPELIFDFPELGVLRDSLAQDVRPFDNSTPFDTHVAAELVRANLWDDGGKEFFEFQSLDLGYMTAILREHGGAYVGWERGLGKTLGTCALIEELDCKRTMIICPNTAKQSVWGDELAKWCPWLKVFVIPNEKAKREAMLQEVAEYGAPCAFIVHYEALPIVAGKKKVGRNTQIGRGWDKLGTWDLIVADEAHRIKDPSAQMSKALKKVPCSMRLALSGSIIQNHAEELFSVLQWLFPLVYRAKWRDWNDRFIDYVDGPFGKLCVGVKLERVEEMRRELGVFMVYRRKEDELDLPPKTYETLLVELSSSQRKAYNDLLRSCEAELEDGTRIKAADGLVMLGRLRQVASGLDLLSEHVNDSSKLDLACDLIADDPDSAYVVFGWYKASCHALAERLDKLGIGSFVVDGDVPQATRAEYIARFQEGEARVFVGTLSTLGESVTLHRANKVIRIDRSWNPALNLQAEDRVQRIGQTRNVTVTDIVAKDTVDEVRVLPVIAGKEALRRLILGGA